MEEPEKKNAIVFVDGQNLFHSARRAFGYKTPNYDVLKLAMKVCAEQGWNLAQIRFYTGVPEPTDNPRWNAFWVDKLATLGHQGVYVFSRPLRYRNRTVILQDGSSTTFLVAQEKGIDVRIALDVIRLANSQSYDVALLFSQDQDLSEVAEEIRVIAKQQDRWIKIASAFPCSPTVRNTRGIDRTDWIKIERKLYDAALDHTPYGKRK